MGYVIAKDRYLKRDELGVVYQLCVAPGEQRKLVGAALIKAVFDRSAYGCKLYCCWCAQDIGANHFWESMGFIPVAFRAGSTGKKRVHIFWQRRINADDLTTPYWYPCQTNGGAIRADRLVFPIPPGTHWSEVKAVILPPSDHPKLEAQKQLPNRSRRSEGLKSVTPSTLEITSGGLRFVDAAAAAGPALGNPPRVTKPKVKNDPKLVVAARELRDRYLEHVNQLPMIAGAVGKYDVARQLSARKPHTPLLAAG